MSKLIVREKLRDLFKNRLSVEESVEIKEALTALYGLFMDKHHFLVPMLEKYSEGYTVPELAQRYEMPLEEVVEYLCFAYDLLGDVLQLDDALVVRRVPRLHRATARNILETIYRKGGELDN